MVISMKMVTVNTCGNLVNEVLAGTDENQKATLGTIMDQCNKIITGKIKRKTCWENCNLHAKKMRLLVIHNILPPEILENIFKYLNYKEICQAQLICQKWKEIIENGNLLKKASGKFLEQKS